MIKQIGLPLRGRLPLLITCMITDQTGLHSVLLPYPFFQGSFPIHKRPNVNPSFHAKVQFLHYSIVQNKDNTKFSVMLI